jgi:mRNA-degrading endonuclease HigB of HigAB toxin-antitoxin module
LSLFGKGDGIGVRQKLRNANKNLPIEAKRRKYNNVDHECNTWGNNNSKGFLKFPSNIKFIFIKRNSISISLFTSNLIFL